MERVYVIVINVYPHIFSSYDKACKWMEFNKVYKYYPEAEIIECVIDPP